MILLRKPLKSLALQLLIAAIFVEANLSVESSQAKSEVSVNQDNDTPAILKYSNYLARFRKAYKPLEAARKAKLFLARTLQIFQHNAHYATKDKSYYLAQNEFTDLTADELADILHVGAGGELEPVAEANRWPDVPADTFKDRFESAQLDEGFSRSSLEEMEANRGQMDFNKILDDDSLRVALEQLNDFSAKHKEQFAEIVDLRSSSNIDTAVKNKANGVKYETIVKSNNKNYVPHMTTSYGIWEEFEIFPEHYKRFGLDTLALDDFKMDPYPIPEIPKHKVLADDDSDGFFNGLLGVIKEIYNSVTDDEDSDDEEWIEVDIPSKGVISYDVDWRSTGCISKVKAQKSCNSCYAFTVIALMEFFHCQQTKKLTDFSVQYIVDCGSKDQLRGCKGGKITNVGRFIRRFGIELNAMYPYNGEENRCPIDDTGRSFEKTGYLRPQISKWQNFHEIASWYKWLPKSPLIVGVNMPTDFLAYGGGVHDGLGCQVGKTHAMLLVGSGKEGDTEFWLMKNSYSEMWGERGYFRLSKKAPVRCFNSAIVVRASFV